MPKTIGSKSSAESKRERLLGTLAKWRVEPGQIWIAKSKSAPGVEHVIACGDCRDRSLVKRVMRDEGAGLVLTDPHYGVSREGVHNDSEDGLRDLYAACFAAMPLGNTAVIAFQSPRLEWVWLLAGIDAGLKPERLLWLYKPADVTFPWHSWIMTSECIRIMSKGKPQWLDTRPYAHDVYIRKTLERVEMRDYGWHPAVKPLSVVRDLISRVGGVVFDPFLGSGTTIVACEELGRPGRGVEIAPEYVALALERLEHMGLEPELREVYHDR